MIEHTYNLPFYKGRPYKCVLVTLGDSGWCFDILELVILRFKLKLGNAYKFKDLIRIILLLKNSCKREKTVKNL